MATHGQPARVSAGYIAIEGPIGVGKTTLAHSLARELGARLVLEDISGNPFLPRFYSDPDSHAFPAQLYFLLTRFKQQRDLAQQELFAQKTVADYLFAKDRIFAGLNLTPDELALYDQVYKLVGSSMARPDLVIYLNARLDVLAERLRRRNWDFERYISLEYLERVAAAYRDFFFYYEDAPLLVVDTSESDFLSEPSDLAALIAEIERAGPGVQHYVPKVRETTPVAAARRWFTGRKPDPSSKA
jgi:deoxyadenosine/deoxycytidine kinase